jgi:hypothetical protein
LSKRADAAGQKDEDKVLEKRLAPIQKSIKEIHRKVNSKSSSRPITVFENGLFLVLGVQPC